MTDVATIAVDKIKVQDDFNVRAEVDGKPEFIESVKTQGILVPLIVEQNGKPDGYVLVAGHRRLHAAKEVGLSEVPAVVRTPGSDQEREIVAAAENISREQLNQVEEAYAIERMMAAGLTEKGVCEAIGISRKKLAERKLVLALPRSIHPYIVDGYLSSKGLRQLVSINEVSAELTEALRIWNDAMNAARESRKEDHAQWQLDGQAVARAAATSGVKGLWPVGLRLGYDEKFDTKGMGLAKDVVKRIAAAKVTEYGYSQKWNPELNEQELDRARAAGVLWVDEEGYRPTGAITDTAMYADLVVSALERNEQSEKDKRGKAAAAAGATPQDADSQAKRREVREKIKALQEKGRAANLALGRALVKGLGSVELTGDVATWLVANIADDPASKHYTYGVQLVTLHELTGGGLRYVFDEYQRTEEKGKAKKPHLVYAEPDKAQKIARKWLGESKDPGQQLGRLLIAVASTVYAIDEVLPRSQRQPARGAKDAAALHRIVKPHLPKGHEALRKRLQKAEQDLAALKRG